MKTVSEPMSILTAYQYFRNSQFIVNRTYQRKLVWSMEEKELLIDSILKNYALPSFLLSTSLVKDNSDTKSINKYEILDGVQRLSAIFDFIENKIPITSMNSQDDNSKYFKIESFPYAKELQDKGIFENKNIEEKNLLSRTDSSKFLNFILPMSIITADDNKEVMTLFRRINSQGHSLSNQDRRRSGVTSDFSKLVDELATGLRGDVSKPIVNLQNMPKLSLDDNRSNKGYGITIEDTFWYKTGILRKDNIIKSEDEEFIADLAASIITGKPFEASQEKFDKLYDRTSPSSIAVNTLLKNQGYVLILGKMRNIFSLIYNVLITKKPKKNFNFQTTVSASSGNHNPSKYAFYAFYMAFYELVYDENKNPSNINFIWSRIGDLEKKLSKGSHSVKASDREKNIALVKGLIETGFSANKKGVSTYSSGNDFVRLISDVAGESERFEFKLGLITYNPTTKKHSYNKSIIQNISKKAVAFSNAAHEKTCHILIGIADSENDVQKQVIDTDIEIQPIKIYNFYVVGVERDLLLENTDQDEWYQWYFANLKKQPISSEIFQLLSNPKTYNYNGCTVLDFEIKNTGKVEKYDHSIYVRKGTNIEEISDVDEIISLTERISKSGNK